MAKTSAKQQAATNFDALFGARQGERIVSGGFKMLSHDRITVRPQVRRTFPKAELEELRTSIHELRQQNSGIEGTGVLQALLVCPNGDGYRLIAGEKRFRATQDEGLSEIPCIIVPAVSEGMVRLLQLTENSQRTTPPVLEEAQAMRETMDEQNLSLRDMARLLGKTLGYVTNRLNLLKMAPDVQEMVTRRTDTLKHAPLIETVRGDRQRAELIRAVVEEQLSVKELERRVKPKQKEARHEIGDGHSTPDASRTRGEVFSRENSNRTSRVDNSRVDNSRIDNSRIDNSGVKNSGVNNAEVDSNRPDPIVDALQPAASFMAEAERILKEVSLSHGYKTELMRHIKGLEKRIERLKQVVG